MDSVITSVRLVVASLLICVAAYTAVILGIAQVLTPQSAQGSLVTDAEGKIIGSRLIAQKFTDPRNFWPRPSAVDYNASGAGGSNKSPTNGDLTARAKDTVTQYAATAENPLPAELAAASGGGLDPHITEHAALYQVQRVAKARGLAEEQVRNLIGSHAFTSGGFINDSRLINVLELNLALDALK